MLARMWSEGSDVTAYYTSALSADEDVDEGYEETTGDNDDELPAEFIDVMDNEFEGDETRYEEPEMNASDDGEGFEEETGFEEVHRQGRRRQPSLAFTNQRIQLDNLPRQDFRSMESIDTLVDSPTAEEKRNPHLDIKMMENGFHSDSSYYEHSESPTAWEYEDDLVRGSKKRGPGAFRGRFVESNQQIVHTPKRNEFPRDFNYTPGQCPSSPSVCDHDDEFEI